MQTSLASCSKAYLGSRCPQSGCPIVVSAYHGPDVEAALEQKMCQDAACSTLRTTSGSCDKHEGHGGGLHRHNNRRLSGEPSYHATEGVACRHDGTTLRRSPTSD